MAEKLALYGGDPIRSKSWPKWPLVNKLCIETLTNQLLNNRWAISGAYDGKRLWNEKFSKAFCKFNGSKYCVTTSSGSTSIISTLEALNIGYGDSVIIPALTWVADAASVLNVNARPILADCNPKTLCIDSESIDSVIENDTKAVIIVHLYSSICDLDSITKYCRDHNLLLIEDCAHVHGAKYKNIGIGNFGICGIFSMQQTKVLTSGEGGCVVTNDIELHEKLQEVRTDGRILNENIHILNELQLEEKGQIMGTNYSLSEVQAVLLYYGLKSLKRQLLIKNKNVKYFKSKLKNYPGISFQETNPKQDGMIYYALPIRFDKSIWPNVKIIKEAMDSELGIKTGRIYNPLNKNILYNPLSKKRNKLSNLFITKLSKTKKLTLPNSEKAYLEYITIPHHLFLGSIDDMNDIFKSIEKIYQNLNSIKKFSNDNLLFK